MQKALFYLQQYTVEVTFSFNQEFVALRAMHIYMRLALQHEVHHYLSK